MWFYIFGIDHIFADQKKKHHQKKLVFVLLNWKFIPPETLFLLQMSNHDYCFWVNMQRPRIVWPREASRPGHQEKKSPDHGRTTWKVCVHHPVGFHWDSMLGWWPKTFQVGFVCCHGASAIEGSHWPFESWLPICTDPTHQRSQRSMQVLWLHWSDGGLLCTRTKQLSGKPLVPLAVLPSSGSQCCYVRKS